jgi:CSLREA domain-containing protein
MRIEMNAIYSTNRKFKRMIVNLLGILVILAIVISATGGVFAQETGPPEAIDYVVTTTDDNDDGTCDENHCSLREAINAANGHPAADIIAFDISGDPPFAIQPGSALPDIIDAVTIDGTTQPGFAGTPVIELNGTNAGESVHGLSITAGHSKVQGLVINRFTGSGIRLADGGANAIEGNFLGTDITGANALGNASDGVGIFDSADNTVDGNIISGNGESGVYIGGASSVRNVIRGNRIGTDVSGTTATGPSGLAPRALTVTTLPETCLTHPAGRDFEGFVSQSGDPLAPWSGTSVHFLGTNGSLPLGNLSSGVLLAGGASDNLIGGTDPGAGNLISGNRFDGVALFGPETTANKVQGNLIGTDADGTAALPNDAGVWIGDGALNTLVGGTDEGAGNLISGNAGGGVSINHPETTGTRVLGNYIGTTRSGDAALPNGADGVFIGASQTWIGSPDPGAGNLISGNGGSGIYFTEAAFGNFVQGNFIGTNVDGTVPLANNQGVTIAGPGTSANVIQANMIGTDVSGALPISNLGFGRVGLFNGAANNLIGGIEPGAGNFIAFNHGPGIVAILEAGSGNAFISNSVFSNGGLGIDLGQDGVTLNDPGDQDNGPNDLQNFPILARPILVDGSIRVSGALWSRPGSTYRIELFGVAACDESGYGEGETFLGFRQITTDLSGYAAFDFRLPPDISLETFFTATATDSAGSTSEFSRCVGLARIYLPLILR